MQLPDYYLPRPPLQIDANTRAACDALLTHSMAHPGLDLTEQVPVPIWQFLCYLADAHPVLLHGSGNPAITEFVPRQSNDISEFGNRKRIYAASDGIWPIYFAILNRQEYVFSMINSCVRLSTSTGERSAPYYFFSINDTALPHRPWQNGTVYILPRDSFEPQPSFTKNGYICEVQQWASATAVQPYARVTVTPDDFPFLAQIRGHNWERIQQRAEIDPDGWPWVEE